MPAAPTIGFQTQVLWDVEAAEAGGFTDNVSDISKLFSESVKSIGIRPKGNNQVLYDIGSPDALAVINGVREYEVVVVFAFQDTTGATPAGSMYNSTGTAGFLYDAIVRQANGRLKTYALELYAAKSATTKTVVTLKGCKVDSIALDVDQDNVFEWTVTFKPETATTGTTLPVFANRTRQANLSAGAYFTFVGAGALDAPSGTAIAYATRKAGFTVKHNLRRVPNIGNPDVLTWAEGKREVTVNADITVDDGGKALFDAQIARTQTNVVMRCSTTASKPKFTLLSTFLDGLDVSYDNSSEIVTTSISRQAIGGVTLGVTP